MKILHDLSYLFFFLEEKEKKGYFFIGCKLRNKKFHGSKFFVTVYNGAKNREFSLLGSQPGNDLLYKVHNPCLVMKKIGNRPITEAF